MKALLLFPLLALGCEILPAADADFAPAPDRSPLEDAIVDFAIDRPTDLQEALRVVTGQLDQGPSVVFKPGSEKSVVPVMQVQRVRFGDLLSALEELCEVRFKVLNPTPEAGERSLLFVEGPPSARPIREAQERAASSLVAKSGPAATHPEGSFGLQPRPGAVQVGPAAPQPEGGFGGGHPALSELPLHVHPEADHSSQDPLGPSDLANSPSIPENLPRPSPPVAETWYDAGGASGRGGDSFSPYTWPADRHPSHGLITQTYAIGSLLEDQEDGHRAQEIIEAINLVWSTSNDDAPLGDGKDSPRISLHEPSRLLIIKAPANLQSLAAQTITNLTSAHQQRRELHMRQNQPAILQDQFRRERDHLEQLHQITLETLKAGHAAEVDRLRAAVAELERQLRTLKSPDREGGN